MSTNYVYLGEWDKLGTPTYLLKEREEISPELIQRIRKSVPEYKPVPEYNPQYLTNKGSRNVIIRSTDEKFEGADINVTFIDEGAGYLNVLGYYIYPLNTEEYDEPTKLVDGKYVPCTYDDSKSLEKIVIFPNFSLVGKGGNMKPGDTVRILYNPKNPDEKFPNNTGVGFFVSPNGFDSKTAKLVNRFALVYSDHTFNNPKIEDGSIQAILLLDTDSSTAEKASFIVGFEDIMRDAGDKDFNDLIFKLTVTPATAYKGTDNLVLAKAETNNNTELVADKTGLYLNINGDTMKTILGLPHEKLLIRHTIKAIDEKYVDWLKTIFETLVLEKNGVIRVDGSKLIVEYEIERNNVSNIVYLIKSINNKTIVSKLDPNVRNIVNFQDYYVTSGSNIEYEIISLHDSAKPESDALITKNGKPNLVNSQEPYSMGDPHITTISGKRYTIPNIIANFTLFDDGELKMTTVLDFYPDNATNKFKSLTFMKEVTVTIKGKPTFTVDLFEMDRYVCPETDNMLPEGVKLLQSSEYDSKMVGFMDNFYKMFGKTTSGEFRFIQFKTEIMGSVTIAISFAPHIGDYINSLSLLSNGLSMTHATGALITPPKL